MIAGTTMSKKPKNNRQFGPPTEAVVEAIEPPKPVEGPQPRLYAPRPCSMCTALRPKGTNYTRVYGHGRDDNKIVRYCRCGFCGHTFKDVS
jgi:hypothetical protein